LLCHSLDVFNAFFIQVFFMAATKTPKNSIAELEQEIAKLGAALDKARAQELAAAGQRQ
jgi:hypothetical protein